MRWLEPGVFWFLLVLPLFWAIWRALERSAERRLERFASPLVLPTLLEGVDFGRRRTRFFLGLFTLFFAIVALARPQLGAREEIIPSEGLDLAILLDVSNSMLAEDTVPSRLKKAKHIVKNFVDRLSGDRVGLVAFAGSAYPAVPLTTDYAFVGQSLEIIDETAIGNQGSNLAKGLQVGIELLERGGVNGTESESSRAMIVISDGEATEGEESELSGRLKELGIRVYSIGVGSSQGGPIPLRDNTGYLRGYKKEPGGKMVHTRLETANLSAIASKTGGKYYNASVNEGEVEEILDSLSSADRMAGVGRRVIVYDELYQYPLALALTLFLAMLTLNERRGSRRSREIALVVVAAATALSWGRGALAASSITEYGETKQGIEAYSRKDYAGALQSFGKAQASSPESLIHRLNLGDALLMSGAPEAAIKEFEQVAKGTEPNQAARGAYNMGKAFEAQSDFEKALQAYQKGLMRLAENGTGADPEVELRLKRALEQAEQQRQQKKQKQGKGEGEPQGDQKPDQPDQKGDEQKKQQTRYSVQRQKPQFKPEKLGESDAKRILQQLQEQEKKSQQRVMRGKTGRPKDDKSQKDW